MIKRDLAKVPKRDFNSAVSLVRDTLEEFGLSQAETARRLKVSPSYLNEVLKEKRGVSVDLALRLEALFGVSASLLIRMQADYDFQKAYHANREKIVSEVERLEVA